MVYWNIGYILQRLIQLHDEFAHCQFLDYYISKANFRAKKANFFNNDKKKKSKK